ncbi:unnamed protein product [Durusdinium trenchii]|uniref:Ribosome biogenesis protein NOP53 n=1 Tax=Durusdinium trenchii TaxID=1381693 RepID=A0ABP0NZ85_9DINO
MARGKVAKKVKKKDKAWSNGRRKFKAQDPVYRGMKIDEQMAHKAKKERCRAPRGDKDAMDIPPLFGSMFGGGKDMLGSEKAKTRKEEVEPEKRKKSKRKGQQTEDGLPAVPLPPPVPGLPKGIPKAPAKTAKELALPNQKPLETAGEYAKRLEREVQKKLQVVQKKASTDHQRQRQKERVKAAKEKRRGKAAGAAADEPPPPAPQVPRFGEVVQRPPSFGKETLKSFAKLQPTKTKPISGSLSDYANKVRDAYEEVKKKRRAQAASAAAGAKRTAGSKK